MKNWIAIAAIIVSFAIFAQQGKGHGNKGHSKGKQGISIKPKGNGNGPIKIKSKGNSGKIRIKPGKGQKGNGNKGVLHPGNNGNKGKVGPHNNAKFHYKKGHVNHVYMYGNGPIYYPTKNYGQWRSQQARNKHKKYHPVLEVDARNAILMISNRNAFLYVEIGNKIDSYERLVIQRHNAGIITDAQLALHQFKIQQYRQAQVQFNIYV